MYGIRPSPLKCSRDKWSNEAKLAFREIVEDDAAYFGTVCLLHFALFHPCRSLSSQVFAVVGDVVRLELSCIKDEGSGAVNINQLLIRRNYAERAEEAFLSKVNVLSCDIQPIFIHCILYFSISFFVLCVMTYFLHRKAILIVRGKLRTTAFITPLFRHLKAYVIHKCDLTTSPLCHSMAER